MKKIIVTGGNGFIGSNLVNFLLSKKFRECLILLPAFYLIVWLMKSPKKFEEIAILKIEELVSF